MAPGDSVVSHISKIQNMAAQLLDLGESVSNLTIMAKILASLSSKYSTLNDEGTSAFAATGQKDKKSSSQKSEKNKKGGKSRNDIECFECHKMGHLASQCEKNKRGPDDNTNDESRDCAFIAERKTTGWEKPSTAQVKALLERDESEV
ncbi:uncharacterized protein LOC117173644 [Belonocnema kinseyi]|uniref:uncharacterized protein LOC117173644 n=1 Tax=Belonocnema kinseyi TaxID=2817044 RepID=UPI00143D3B4E|nr:uncharacterized protein LOC117173644 [Belonocnema kinseyi]